MIGQAISHYKILEKLGEGGMGIVYKAEDLTLDRPVALKFLPQHLTVNEAEQARFLQEAKAASAINHPHVCIIHAVEEHEGQKFIVMEYVDGITLRKKFEETPVKVNDAITYAVQIGEALQEAHGKGIVHRDIKSDNIMVNSKNQIKVMDFGLAKLKGSLKLTRTSSTVGTLAYMAPEQIQGGEVDARSDIFSFGVVLFELLTGRTPFRGEHEAAIVYSIVNEEPESLVKLRSEAPPELERIINRALEKDPEDRYQSAADMVSELRRLLKQSSRVSRRSLAEMPVSPAKQEVEATQAPGPVTAAPKPRRFPVKIVGMIAGVLVAAALGYYFFFMHETNGGDRIPIAVADFVNQTKETELDGLSGMLITAMEQSKRLVVLTRSHMFDILKQMGKSDVDRIDEALGKEICRQANVGALVTASIRKFGKLYTIDLKVLDPQKNEYIFTAKEEGEGQESIPSMLDKLSEKTRIGLKEKAAEVKAASANVANVTTTNLEAYQHFFQGEQHINHLKFDDAEKEFRKAVELDSTFGLAWYRLTYTLNWNTATNYRAKEPLRKALSLISRIPGKEQYLLRALDAEQDGKFAQSVQILRDMEKIYPDDKEMIYNIGDWSYHAGDLAAASTYLEKVLQVDPTFERALQHLTWTYRDQGQFEKMIDVAKRYVSASGSSEAYGLLKDGYVSLGQFDLAMKAMQSVRELFPKRYEFTGSIANLYLQQGQFVQAEAELKSLIAESQPSEAKKVGYGGLTSYFSYLGRLRDALRADDERIKILWENKDTVGVINRYLQRGMMIASGRKDANDARKEAEKALAYQPEKRGQTRINLASWYAFQGDIEAVDTLSRSIMFVRPILFSVVHSARQECERAEAYLDSAFKTTLPPVAKIISLYSLFRCQFQADQIDKALATVNRLLAFKEALGTNEYVGSLYLLGKIYEKKGERKLAIENYEKFLSIWKNADKDLPDYVEAKARLAKLKGVALK